MQIREDIVKAAAHIFSRDGYAQARLQDVAEMVGMRKASLYYHIDSKEDLLFAIHEHLISELLTNTRQALSTVQSSEERLRVVIRMAMRLIAEHQEEVTVFLHEYRVLNNDRWEEVVAKRDEHQQIVEDILTEGIEQGVFREIPVKITTLGIFGMTNYGYQWFRRSGTFSADEIADVFSDVVLNGIRTGVPGESAGDGTIQLEKILSDGDGTQPH